MNVENYSEDEINGLSIEQIKECLYKSVEGRRLNKVLLVPPDYTRLNSGAGLITSFYYDILKDAHVDILPALGTHVPMTGEEQIAFFGDKIPPQRYLVHNWRDEVVEIGRIPRKFVYEVSEGLVDEPMPVEISKYLLDSSYDLILSIGQVVPHEVAGMANYTKNIVIGCGGSRFINLSHMLGAFYGLERIMGIDQTPVRKIFDYAQKHFLSELNIEYVLTVTVTHGKLTKILGLYAGKTREGFNRAVKLSRKHNLIKADKPFQTCIVYLDETEYHSTWLGNKAIYRTRMAMADGGRLVILAPGVKRFGEDDDIDKLIRKYGYIGRENILKLCKANTELSSNLSAAAHLIHGSSDGRFEIIYAVKHLTRDDIKNAGFTYMSYQDAIKIYPFTQFKPGYNTLPSGDDIYYIENPALGLWTV